MDQRSKLKESKLMIGKLLSFLVILFTSSTLYAADLSSATCPGTGCVNYNTSGLGSIGIQITGTWSGTITFQATVDNSTYTSFRVVSAADSTATGVTTTTANGLFNGTVAGINQIRIVFTAYTSGTAVITTRTINQAAKFTGGGSGGGGSGTVTHTSGALTANAVVVGNGTDDVKVLAALGAAGTVLTSNGAGVPPSFQAASSGPTCESHTASASASLDFTTVISGSYNAYQIFVNGLIPSTANQDLWVRFGTGAGPTWDSTAAHYGWVIDGFSESGSQTYDISGGDAQAVLAKRQMTSDALASVTGMLILQNPNPGTLSPYYTGNIGNRDNAVNSYESRKAFGRYAQSTSITGVRFLFASGNIASGSVSICPMPH